MADEQDTLDTEDPQGLLPFDDGTMGRLIRRQWHAGRWFFSVVDVVSVLTDTKTPRRFWSDLKRRLHDDEGFSELYANIVQLKIRSLDGKKYATDAADAQTMLRVVQSIDSPKAEQIKQWLAKVGAQKLDEVAAGLDEDQRRLLLRGEVASGNTSLTDAATAHGLVTARDFALFHDAGYKGLYDGETARMIATRKGVPPGAILDYMGSEELAANWFRITQGDAQLRKLANDGVTGKTLANDTHYGVGREVRAAIERIGGTPPEQLPTPEQSIRDLERAEQQRIEAERNPSLWDAADSE